LASSIIQLAVENRVFDKLMTFDAEAAEFEDGSDAAPDADDEEEDGSAVLARARADRAGKA